MDNDTRTLTEIAESMLEFDPTARAEQLAEAGEVEQPKMIIDYEF